MVSNETELILNDENETIKIEYLECEKRWIFLLLMSVAGYMGGFTYSIRGGIFCNAQTGNLVFLAVSLGNMAWAKALYYFVPLITYIIGTICSELMGNWVKKWNVIRWDTLFIIIEMITIIGLGFLPETASYRISQVIITLLCSMQYNTFRKAQGTPMATTICTNHVSQVGVGLAKIIRHKNKEYLDWMTRHLYMLISFLSGAIISAVLSKFLLGKAIWFTLIPLVIVLIDFLYADFKKEKGYLSRIPRGH